MFCRVIRHFSTISDSTSSVTGTSNFMKDPIKNHDKTLHHKKCIGAQSVASFPEWMPSAKNILKVNQAHRKSSSVRTKGIFALMIVIWLFYTVQYMTVDICVLKMFQLLSNFLHKKKCFIRASSFISSYQILKSACLKGYQGFWNFASPAMPWNPQKCPFSSFFQQERSKDEGVNVL